MSAQNIRLDECFLGDDSAPGVSLSTDSDTLDGTVAIGSVTIEGTAYVVAVTVYPASDVSGLNVSSLGSKVRTALLTLT